MTSARNRELPQGAKAPPNKRIQLTTGGCAAWPPLRVGLAADSHDVGWSEERPSDSGHLVVPMGKGTA